MSKTSKRPNRANRPSKKMREHIHALKRVTESSMYTPSSIEAELTIAWQEFAHSQGFFVTHNHRVPDVEMFNRLCGTDLGFITILPSNPKERELYETFAKNALIDGMNISILELDESFSLSPIFVYGAMPDAATVCVGWRVARERHSRALTVSEVNNYQGGYAVQNI